MTAPDSGSGDGWTRCAAGHRHWGLFGAAGLLVLDRDRVILQHRAPWTHNGDTWAIPGGARDRDETAVQAALREAAEEAGITADDVLPVALYCDDHGGWSYTTVLAAARREIVPRSANAESVSVRWVPTAAVADLALHAGFAASWPYLMEIPEPVHLVVSTELADDPVLSRFATLGIGVDHLPTGARSGHMTRLIPQIHWVSGQLSAALVAAEYAATSQVVLVLDEADLSLLGNGP
jgi:8-oxo-dGTP diphosphatase